MIPVPSEQALAFGRRIADRLGLDLDHLEPGSLIVEWSASEPPVVTWTGRATLELDELRALFAQASADADDPDGRVIISPTCTHDGDRTIAGICSDCGAEVR